MKVVFLGTGTPSIELGPLRAGASEVVLIDGDVILFDCGRWVSMRLVESGVGLRNVTHLFLTHIHHRDHTVGLPTFLFSRCKSPNLLQIYGPEGTEDFLAEVKDCFKGDLSLERAWGRVVVEDVDEGLVCEGESWKIMAARTLHIGDHGEPSLAYRIDSVEGSVVISGDVTVHPPSLNRDKNYSSNLDLKKLANGADMYIMDAGLGHTTLEELGRAAEEAGVKVAVMTHLRNPGFASQYRTYDDFVNRISSFFTGEIVIAEDLKTLEI